MSDRSIVPCNGCTACCCGQIVALEPTDRLEDYDAAPGFHPLTGEPAWLLKQKANGECIHLGSDGCTVYENAPAVCRSFDCRRHIMRIAATRAQRRALIRESKRDPVIMAGIERLPTLTADEVAFEKVRRGQ